MDVATKALVLSQAFGNPKHIGHRRVWRPDDAGGQKQPFDVVSTIELDGQPNHFGNGKAGPLNIGRDAVHAVGAVIDTEIRHQDLEKRDAATVRRVSMANTRALVRAESLAVATVSLGTS